MRNDNNLYIELTDKNQGERQVQSKEDKKFIIQFKFIRLKPIHIYFIALIVILLVFVITSVSLMKKGEPEKKEVVG